MVGYLASMITPPLYKVINHRADFYLDLLPFED
jgi:hypothetical protein